MRIPDLVAAAAVLLAAHAIPAAAQRTGDRARLVFTVSGGYVQGRGLWTVTGQPVQQSVDDTTSIVDRYSINRSIKGTLAAGFSGTYYPGGRPAHRRSGTPRVHRVGRLCARAGAVDRGEPTGAADRG